MPNSSLMRRESHKRWVELIDDRSQLGPAGNTQCVLNRKSVFYSATASQGNMAMQSSSLIDTVALRQKDMTEQMRHPLHLIRVWLLRAEKVNKYMMDTHLSLFLSFWRKDCHFVSIAYFGISQFVYTCIFR